MSTVYADVLFFTNFCMDFLALWLTGSLLHTPKKLRRLFFASTVGAVYALSELLLGGHPLVSAVVGVGVSLLLCYIAYGDAGLFRFVRVFLVFWAVSVLLGGLITVFYTWLSSLFGSETLPLRKSDILLTLGALSGVVVLGVQRFFTRHAGGREVGLYLSLGDREVTVHALSDSGNLLSDPISGKPVVLLRLSAAKRLLPKDYCFPDDTTLIPDERLPRMHPVFVETPAGREMMWAFTPDTAAVDMGKRRHPVTAVLAVDRRDAPYGMCDALVPVSFLP